MDGSGDSGAWGQAGYAITGSGGGGAGGQFVFADLGELDGIIAELETIRDDIRKDGDKLWRAQQLIEPPAEDIMSRVQAKAVVDCLEKAIDHNKKMRDYADAEITKMRAARNTYASTDEASAARLRNLGNG